VRKTGSIKGRSIFTINFHYLILILLFTPLMLMAQEEHNTHLQGFKDAVNTRYGTDDILVNGPLYLPEHNKADGHPCFLVNDYIDGTIFIKDKIYNDVKIKYDIELDKLILHEELTRGASVSIILNTVYIDSFHIADYRFVSSHIVFRKDTLPGYYELVYHDEMFFLIKHFKEFRGDYNEKTPFGRYTSDNSKYYVYMNKALVAVNSKKAFLSLFPEKKTEIKKFLKSKGIKYKKAGKEDLYKLMRYCHEVSSG
jgi:hypothetical protein